MQKESFLSKEEQELALNDLIYRRASPYFPNEPYTLLGEYLVMNFPGCLFVGFQIGKETDLLNVNNSYIYVGISEDDRRRSREDLDRAMNNNDPDFSISLEFESDIKNFNLSSDLRKQFSDKSIELSQEAQIIERDKENLIIVDENQKKYYAVKKGDNELNVYRVIKAYYYRHEDFVRYDGIALDYSNFKGAIDEIKEERYWINEFVKDDLEAQFEAYAKRLEKQIKKIVLFWSMDNGHGDFTSEVRRYLPQAIVNTFPIQEMPSSDSQRKLLLPVDDIDTMRWFTNRFEEGWHPQPNEQVGFLVLDTQSYSQSDSETPSLAGEKLGFEGWLDYKYTGNLFLNSPPVLQIFLERIEKSFNHPPETQGSNKAVDENIVFAKDIVTKFLEERFGELKENAMNLQGALEALNIMQSHLLEAVDKVFDCLRESSYDSDLIKPILSATFEDAKTNDEKKIKRLVGLAKKWAEGNNESEDITFPETITDRHIHVLFYINLFMRRVLLEIPQTLEIGFAPYFMEVGFADYTRLEDARNFTPRRESDIEKTGISGKNDAVYKLLGEIERLFGIGGKDEWTFYMPSAPLFGHGQRRDFCCGLLSSELAKRVREANEKQAEVSQ